MNDASLHWKNDPHDLVVLSKILLFSPREKMIRLKIMLRLVRLLPPRRLSGRTPLVLALELSLLATILLDRVDSRWAARRTRRSHHTVGIVPKGTVWKEQYTVQVQEMS